MGVNRSKKTFAKHFRKQKYIISVDADINEFTEPLKARQDSYEKDKISLLEHPLNNESTTAKVNMLM